MSIRSTLPVAVASWLAFFFGGPPLAGQEFPAFGGVEARLGSVSPEDTRRGLGLSADLDLGYIASPSLRSIVGVSYMGADVDRVDGQGSFTAVGGRVGLRLDPLAGAGFTPFALATINAYDSRFNLMDNPGLARALSGWNAGVGLGAGAALALDEEHRTIGTFEARRTLVNNLNHWALEIGFRYAPRGRGTYAPVLPRDRR